MSPSTSSRKRGRRRAPSSPKPTTTSSTPSKSPRRPDSDDYYLTVAVSGEPPRERKPEKGEKAEDKERLDKQFADALTKLDERLKAEKALASWTFVVAGKTLEPLLKDRAALIAKPRKPGAGGPPGMPPGMMFPGMR